MKEPKMNKMAKICMQNKAFTDSYQNLSQELNKISVTFLNKKVVDEKKEEIEKLMEWFANQRFPKEK